MSGRVGVEQTPDIEAVLAEHEDATGWQEDAEDNLAYECSCGDRSPALAKSGEGISPWEVEQAAMWHRAHVAQALAPVLAAAVREARAAELREAAEECEPHHGFGARWLRDRADRIAVDAPEGGEGR